MRPSAFRILLAGILLFFTACSDAPSESEIRQTLGARLETAFPEPLLEIVSLRRLGTTPLPADESGASRTIVYYNARLKLLRDYAFGDWTSLNPAAFAQLLGAGERGIEGIRPAGSSSGDELRVRGSVTFRAVNGEWTPVEYVGPAPGAAPPPDNTAPPAIARRLVEQILALFDDPPTDEAAAARTIITEELTTARREIDRRLERLRASLTIAGGPEGGEYHRVAETIAAADMALGMAAVALTTEGSVENIRLLLDGIADLALVQSDIAAAAVAGELPLAGGWPIGGMHALASLFPEPVHVIARPDAGIARFGDLRGRHVDLGLPDSGSTRTATAVLRAHGLAPGDLGQVAALGLAGAVQELRSGQIDAAVGVISAPARALQRLAAGPGMTLIPLKPEAVEALTGGDDGLIRLTLPVGTYPGQREDLSTVAVTALLVARADMPDAEVESVLRTIYEHVDFFAAGSAAGAQISRARALDGLTIPLHPAARAYFAK